MKNNYFIAFCVILVMLVVLPTSAQTKAQKEQIISRYNLEALQDLSKQFESKTKVEKAVAQQMAMTNGWPLVIEKEGTYMELQKVSSEGRPIYYRTFNVAAAKSTRADHLNSGGSLGLSLDGLNMTAHVWDGGLARSSHQEFK